MRCPVQPRVAELASKIAADVHSGHAELISKTMASSYQYVELAAAVQGPEGRHNLYAYVAECSAPRATRGTGARRAPTGEVQAAAPPPPGRRLRQLSLGPRDRTSVLDCPPCPCSP